MIIFESVTKIYNKKPVLEDINLSIQGREFVSLVGHSGAGKSTLIKLLIGSLRPSFGSITVDGYEVNRMKENILQVYRRRLGIIFQDYKLLPHKTVYENVAFAMEVCEKEEDEIELKVPEVLALVGILHLQDSFPHQLSGGEQQKCAIARALVHSPKLIIADEPTGNLDPEATKDVIKLLQKINQDLGITIILASHDRDMINLINRRVVFLKDGKIIDDQEKSGYDITVLEDLIDEKGQEEIKVTEMHIE